MVHLIDGMFSFVLYDANKDEYFACRDHVGITTLYQGWRNSDKTVWFASEMKALNQDCDRIIAFPPGHYYSSKTGETSQYYNPSWYSDIERNIPSLESEKTRLPADQEQEMYSKIRNALEMSVRKRLMSDVPYGVLLSGGLDSSLIASIAMRCRRTAEDMSAMDDDVRCNLILTQLRFLV